MALSPPIRKESLVGWAHGLCRRARCLGSAWAVLAALSGCDESGARKTRAEPSASARPPPLSQQLSRKITCKEEHKGARFLLGEVGKRDGTLAKAEAAIDLPFAIEAGAAVATSEGFAVAALKGNQALVALLKQHGGGGAEIKLDEVHGDVSPPKLVNRGDLLVAVVVNNDAGSETLSLVGVERAAGQAALVRGGQVTRGRDIAGSFDVALGDEQGLLVWDRWDKASASGTVEALPFALDSLTGSGPPFRLSVAGEDAELPRLVPRAGGYWLSWVSHGSPDTRPMGKAPKTSDAEGLDSVIDLTPRRLKVVPLGSDAKPSAEPLMITSPDAHVLAYDVVPFGTGVLLAWRDDPTTLGVEAPSVQLARVAADGSVEREVLEDEALGAGAPKLLVDAGKGAQPQLWLALMGRRGVSRLGYFEQSGKLARPLRSVSSFGVGEPLAVAHSRFLLGTPNGRALDLSLTRCRLEASKP